MTWPNPEEAQPTLRQLYTGEARLLFAAAVQHLFHVLSIFYQPLDRLRATALFSGWRIRYMQLKHEKIIEYLFADSVAEASIRLLPFVRFSLFIYMYIYFFVGLQWKAASFTILLGIRPCCGGYISADVMSCDQQIFRRTISRNMSTNPLHRRRGSDWIGRFLVGSVTSGGRNRAVLRNTKLAHLLLFFFSFCLLYATNKEQTAGKSCLMAPKEKSGKKIKAGAEVHVLNRRAVAGCSGFEFHSVHPKMEIRLM